MEKYEKMKSFDPEIYASIQDETNRQNNKIELIASENFVSERIMEAHRLQTNMQRVIRENVTTAVANTLTL